MLHLEKFPPFCVGKWAGVKDQEISVQIHSIGVSDIELQRIAASLNSHTYPTARMAAGQAQLSSFVR